MISARRYSNAKARHGKNKQKRNDCRQVAFGMAFDVRGLPLAHEAFEGNISDAKTLIHILDRLRLARKSEKAWPNPSWFSMPASPPRPKPPVRAPVTPARIILLMSTIR